MTNTIDDFNSLWREPKEDGHRCPRRAYADCYENVFGQFMFDCDEYEVAINYCPFCGEKSPISIEEGRKLFVEYCKENGIQILGLDK